MITTMGIAYLVFGTLLFGLWIYGLVSLYYDVKRQLIPAVRARRERDQNEQTPDEVALQRLSQLYGQADEE